MFASCRTSCGSSACLQKAEGEEKAATLDEMVPIQAVDADKVRGRLVLSAGSRVRLRAAVLDDRSEESRL
jgi:hypothetical protein